MTSKQDQQQQIHTVRISSWLDYNKTIWVEIKEASSYHKPPVGSIWNE